MTRNANDLVAYQQRNVRGSPMTVAAHALAFGYPGRTIGAGLDLALDEGEVLAVLGPNGSGKTTLFRTLLGLLDARGGSVSIGGRPLTDLGRAEIARAIAYVPQASSAYFDFSVLEMVTMGRTAHLGAFAQPGQRDRALASEALARLGISALAERSIAEVSGGERQLALIARALVTEAKAIVLDEPTANLDFGNQARVLAEIGRLRDDGIAVLLCTHDPDHALEIADRALLLREGKVLAQGPTATVLTGENLSALYGLPVKVMRIAGGGLRAFAAGPSSQAQSTNLR
jgi:iron complex transport system ATP-binding protein